METLRVWKMDLDKEGNLYFGNDQHLSYYNGMQLRQLWVHYERAWINSVNAITPDEVYVTGETILARQNPKTVELRRLITELPIALLRVRMAFIY